MPKLKEILIDFENYLKKQCATIANEMQLGLEHATIATLLESIGIRNEFLETLYNWKNGIKHNPTRYVGEFDFFPEGKMIPLEDAISYYKEYTKENIWQESYFPVFTTYAGDYLLFDIDKNNKTYAMLLLYSPNLLLTTPIPAYDSMDNFFETLIECYKSGAYKFDQRERIEIDYELEQEISKRLNPNSGYWVE